MAKKVKIGVLATQGDFIEHVEAVNKLDADAVQVRLPDELKGIDGLIIPGGESTTISLLMSNYHLFSEISGLAAKGLPVFGTCAGMIMMAKHIQGNTMHTLGLMDITVKRNAFGRQVDSFEADLHIPVLGTLPFPGVFIRAPLIEKCDNHVRIIATLSDGRTVAVQQEKMLAAAFHPELTEDLRFHHYFLDIVTGK